MILFLILGITALVLCVVFIVGVWDFIDSILAHIWLCIYAPIVAGIIWLIVFFIVGGTIGLFPEKKYIPTESINIVAMSDNFQTGGNFFLGTGSLNGVPYYFYYEQAKDSGYIQGKVKAENAVIYEQDSLKNPKIQFYTKEFVDSNWENWSLSFACSHERAEIFVPKGSIKRNFNFDLN